MTELAGTLMPERTLPDYDNPPAQETWMAFRFAPLEWNIPHFGAFWNEIRADYPTFEVHPPIGEFAVRFDAMGPNAVVNIPVRCWFINPESDRLIQVQNNRFFHNWRRTQPGDKYLHYDELKPVFHREWNRFCDFAKRHAMGIPNVLQCEVCYINHLERGVGWDHYSDLGLIFPSVGNWVGKSFLSKPETASLNASYVMPSNEGRLHVLVQPALRQSDGKEIIQLTITGSCRPSTSEESELFRCLDFCRDWVVLSFDDLTSEHMHKIWGRK